MHLHFAERLGAEATRYALRRKNAVDGRWYCGTVITVPYRMVACFPDSAEKFNDARKGAVTGWVAPGFISSGYLAQKQC